MISRLGAIPGLDVNIEPSGAVYILPRVSTLEARLAQRGTPGGSTGLAGELLDQARVAVVPGAACGADDQIRLSYASAMETLRAGLDRIERFVAELPA